MAPAPQEVLGKRVLELSQVSPAPGSDSPETLPLTFFDYVFLPFHPVERVFFYDLPCSASEFLRSHVPELKRSLSLALCEFRPLAGRLRRGRPGGKPEIRCRAGDSVPFAVATSGDDFYNVAGNHPRYCRQLYPLVPPLPPASEAGQPLLALQVTLFPNAGCALGITVSHAVADGSTSAHFLKTWAGICQGGKEEAAPPPSYDRSVVLDPAGLTRTFHGDLERLKDDRGMDAWDVHGREDVVRATFPFSLEKLEKLEEAFSSKTGAACSPYTAAAGFVWASLVRARGSSVAEKEYFGFVTGCRARLKPPAPATYFGNCLGICRVEAERGDLEGDEGPIIASTAIWKVICDLEKEGPFRGAENWVRDIYEMALAGILTVAGSPKLGLYQVDFGWGRPRKIEIVSIERTSAISIAEWGEDGRGLEIGLAIPRDLMDRFSGLVAEFLK